MYLPDFSLRHLSMGHPATPLKARVLTLDAPLVGRLAASLHGDLWRVETEGKRIDPCNGNGLAVCGDWLKPPLTDRLKCRARLLWIWRRGNFCLSFFAKLIRHDENSDDTMNASFCRLLWIGREHDVQWWDDSGRARFDPLPCFFNRFENAIWRTCEPLTYEVLYGGDDVWSGRYRSDGYTWIRVERANV